MKQFGCRFVVAATGVRVASCGHIRRKGTAPEDVCFWFQADPAFVCVSFAWANKSSSWLVLVWPTTGRQWGARQIRMKASKRSVSRSQVGLTPAPGFSDLSVSGWQALWRGFLEFRSKQDMLGLKIKSCEVFLVWMEGSLQTEAIEEKAKVTQTWREHWEGIVAALPL